MTSSSTAGAWERQPADPETYDGGLIELPDRSWLDPKLITGVRPYDGMLAGDEYAISPSVEIYIGEERARRSFDCASPAETRELGAWLAAIANQARRLSNK